METILEPTDNAIPDPSISVGVVKLWTTAETCRWLQKEGLGSFIPLLETHGITGADLLDLNHDDLKSIGIVTFAERKSLLRAAARLRQLNALQPDVLC